MIETINFNDTKADLQEQFNYCEQVRSIINDRYSKQPKAFVHTYGCQQNVSDSERLKGLMELMGYGFTDDLNEADLVLYNTCAVREHAEDRVFGNVGILKANKQRRPGMIICVCGCMAHQPRIAEKIKKSYPYVDIHLERMCAIVCLNLFTEGFSAESVYLKIPSLTGDL